MWIKVNFKGKQVWAECGADGLLISNQGRTPVRYSDKPGSTVYGGGTSRIERIGGEAPRELEAGVSADSAGPRKQTGKGSGFGSAGKRTAGQAQAAVQDLKARMAALPEGTHLAFTDGACKGNPGPAGAGAVLKLADGRVLEDSRSCGVATNNVGELTAIDMAIDLLEGAGIEPTASVALFTDSSYAIGVLQKGWKAKANVTLILGLRQRLRAWPGLSLHWVPGHSGVPENERADELAVAGCVG